MYEGDEFDDGEDDEFIYSEYVLDDTLDPLSRLEKYHTSDFSLTRLVLCREMYDTAVEAGYVQSSERLLPLLANFVADTEPAVRQVLAEQLYPLGTFFLENAKNLENGYQELINTFIPYTFELIIDKNNEVSRAATRSLVKIGELIKKDHVEAQLLSVIHNLAHDESVEEYRIAAADLFNELAHIFGEKICREVVVKELMILADDMSLLVRKTVAQHIGKFCSIVGVKTTSNKIVPFFMRLCKDDIWGVRKACAEVFPIVSSYVSQEIRTKHFISQFHKFAEDSSRWVKMEAFKQLGPFIATFAINPPKPSIQNSSKSNTNLLQPHMILKAPSVTFLAGTLGSSKKSLELDKQIFQNQIINKKDLSICKKKIGPGNIDEETASAIKPLIHHYTSMSFAETDKNNNTKNYNLKFNIEGNELNEINEHFPSSKKHQFDDEKDLFGDDQNNIQDDEEYMGGTNETVNSDFVEFCAYNFPAVCYTLGPKHWHLLSKAYLHLVKSKEWRVRKTLSSSLHEIAKILGTEKTEKFLIEPFEAFLNDLDEVKIGVISHLTEFMENLTGKIRTKYLEIICKINEKTKSEVSTLDVQNSKSINVDDDKNNNFTKPLGSDIQSNDPEQYENWRIRNEIAIQLGKLTYLFTTLQVKDKILKLFFNLMKDNFCEVRKTAAKSTAIILKRLITSGEKKGQEELINFIVNLIDGNVHQKLVFLWSFDSLLKSSINEKILHEIISKNFLEPFFKVSKCKIPNIKIVSAQIINNIMLQHPKFKDNPKIHQIREELKLDKDRDVKYFSNSVNIR